MAQDVKPTRSELIELKKKIKLSESGHKLLKMKRDGLILEFFKILNEARNVRTELDAAYENGVGKINLACAVNGMVAVRSTAFTAKQSPEIQLSGHNIMGVVVPKISSTGVRKSLYERGYGIIGTNSYIDETAEAYEDLVEKIITAAELETTMKRLLNEIEKTKRRVNALEFKVIPDLIATMKYIRFTLEEMEREGTSRLKRVKERMKNQA
ncbi:ATP synthase subunit D [Methanosarcina sp. 2.H.T.1A.6]|jgi:V/A-type H+-transporting ATPase subunit D|uniref:V-type ATP synthase subunit D n=1 Tax=unclassified Methanosarcina TaxID=2644672 RepID=UPI000621702B|nr:MULTISPECIES: V-type ATP synthase subunit D [unclassified Methanosarcina]KKG11136.1 ATP synthase subunit D [Methanosarcina sp. 2.H.A.1B.4]KKG13444.1 ATP synthase subunit D [Methanosarcina sp. 2.H.T.1A.3]KKG23499.1 ATP synthase subunit D [Methanosarcina sp. 2.H.T.1A.6]KKG24663.1 ATP synthase subunit D [Methanosarcina sp. 2.H.T.1A.15]KKG24686.1 ATP synthase subunit D [Methanosarcina sp. 2.H.T.1A.8]